MMSLYRNLKSSTLKRRESSLGLPETQQQQPQLYSSEEQLNSGVANNNASNTFNSITTTAIKSVSSNNNSSKMVSRRKILSRSRDDLNLETSFVQDDQDTWHQKDKLFREHIQEVLDKWTQIDDEIWAKVIIFEKNRRVAKAYARTPVLTINGSDDGFDGMRIGLCGFDNPLRDQKTEEVKRHIGQGAKLKMDESGNILVRRYSKSNIYVKGTGNLPTDETAIGNDIIKSSNQALEFEKVVKIFDMKKFQSNVNRELSRAYPDRRRLETQCMSVLTFVKGENDVLDCPIWILIINVVAMDMLKSKLPPVHRQFDIKNRPRIPVPDEDPYSNCNEIDSSGSSGFGASGIYGHIAREQHMMMQSHNYPQLRREKPPKLPPRENTYHHDLHTGALKPDYDEIDDDAIRIKLISRNKSEKAKNYQRKYGGDDLYYCGLRAKQTIPKEKLTRKTSHTNEDQQTIYVRSRNRIPPDEAINSRSISHIDRHQPTFSSLYQLNQINDPRSSLYQRLHHHSYMASPGRSYNNYNLGHKSIWHARSYESGIDSEFVESPYHIYGRLPTPSSRGGSRGYISANSRYIIGDWE